MKPIRLMFILCCTSTLLLGCGSDNDPVSTSSSSESSLSTSSSSSSAAAWELVWSDEFDTQISETNWSREVNCFGGGNNERQCYTNRPDNAFVSDDGVLHLVAKEESFSGPSLGDDEANYDPNDTSITLPYTSARIRSKNLFDFTYGRVEIRAQLPGGQGTWPALWMLPTDWIYGGWPSSGEIDIMEAVNLNTEGVANEIHGTLHYGLPWPQWVPWGDNYVMTESATASFHEYAIEWEADEIRWFVDGIHYQTQTSAGWYNYIWQGQSKGFDVANPRAPYDQSFHLIMNVAVGGDFPGAPDTNWTASREMLIDYVRVYQCNTQSVDGVGCASTTNPVNSDIAINAEAGAPQVNSFPLFTEAPDTLMLQAGDTTIENTFVINVWEEAAGNVGSSITDIGDAHGNVWAVNFTGLGNVALTAGSMADAEGFTDGLALTGNSGWTSVGQLVFDLYVASIDSDTTLSVKLDSGYPNLGQVEIETPTVGEWSQVAISISSLLNNPEASGTGLDISHLLNAFVLEPSGTNTAQVWIDNIRLECAINSNALDWQQDKTCGINPIVETQTSGGFIPEVVFFSDIVNTELWDLGYQEFSTAGDHIAQNIIDDGTGNSVLDLEFLADGADGVAWIGATDGKNLSDFAAGTLSFDVKVLDWADSTSGLMIKLECPAASCTTGDYSIGNESELGTNEWHTINIPVADLINNDGSNLDINNIANLVLFPAWGDSQGVHFQLDNIKISMAVLTIFNEIITHWNIGICCGGVAAEVLADPVDVNHGNVVEFNYSADTTVTFFQSSTPSDLSAWAGGTIEFDLFIEAEPVDVAWMMKVDCEFPCGTGDVPLESSIEGVPPTLGAWQHFTFNLNDLVELGLELSHVDTPLVIFPAWGNQNGAIFRVDNIILTKSN